jgi:hypothetical protein
MKFELDENTQKQLRAVREFLRDYSHMRYTVLTILGVLGIWSYWHFSTQLFHTRNSRTHLQKKNDLLEEIQSLEKYIRSCEEFMPDAERHDQPWWMDQFQALAKKSFVALDRIVPTATGTKIGDYPVLRFQLVAFGSYSALIRFVTQLEQVRPLLRIEGLGIEEGGGKDYATSLDFLPGERQLGIEVHVTVSPRALD